MFTYTNTDKNNRCAYFSHRKIYWLFRKKNQQHASVGRIKLYLPKCDKIICNRAVNKLKYMNNWTIYIDLHTLSQAVRFHTFNIAAPSPDSNGYISILSKYY